MWLRLGRKGKGTNMVTEAGMFNFMGCVTKLLDCQGLGCQGLGCQGLGWQGLGWQGLGWQGLVRDVCQNKATVLALIR